MFARKAVSHFPSLPYRGREAAWEAIFPGFFLNKYNLSLCGSEKRAIFCQQRDKGEFKI